MLVLGTKLPHVLIEKRINHKFPCASVKVCDKIYQFLCYDRFFMFKKFPINAIFIKILTNNCHIFTVTDKFC